MFVEDRKLGKSNGGMKRRKAHETSSTEEEEKERGKGKRV